MRKIILTAAIAAAAIATPALAADNTGSLVVQSTVDPSCVFVSQPAALVTVSPTTGEKPLGDLGYSCNFVGTANLTLSLPAGTNLTNPTYNDTVQYGLRWALPGNESAPAQYFAPGDYPFTYTTAAAPNTEIKGALVADLTTALTVAGTYSSTIIYSILP